MMETRRRALIEASTGPSRYKKLEYIVNKKNSLLAGILAPRIPAESMIIAVEFKYLGDTDLHTDLIGINGFSIGRRFYPYAAAFMYNDTLKQGTQGLFKANTQYTVYADIEEGHQDLYVNGHLEISLTEDTLQSLRVIRFMTYHGNSSIYGQSATFYCEFQRAYCRSKLTNALLFDFTPVLDTETNLAGVEDAITGGKIWEAQINGHSGARLGYKTLDGVIVAPIEG